MILNTDIWCLTIVRRHFWDSQAPFLDCQAPVLGLSGTSFGIVRHQFWDLTLIFRVQKGAETVLRGLFQGILSGFRAPLCQYLLY